MHSAPVYSNLPRSAALVIPYWRFHFWNNFIKNAQGNPFYYNYMPQFFSNIIFGKKNCLKIFNIGDFKYSILEVIYVIKISVCSKSIPYLRFIPQIGFTVQHRY